MALKVFLLSAMLLCTGILNAQDIRKITGVVTDEDGEVVIGATVYAVPKKKAATVTDIDGNFSLSVPSGSTGITVSSIGYKPATISLSNKSHYEIRLNIESQLLNETVVVGYGSVRKSTLSNSQSTIKGEDIAERNVTNVASAMQGMMAGVEISSNSGAPGSDVNIIIRGAASINADATPLYVVDGVPVDNISDLSVQDIKSIDVLKDAASSAIYGSRGANGVVLITTKQPKAGDKLTIQASASWGIQSIERYVDVLSPEEWIQWRTKVNDIYYMTDPEGKLGLAKGKYHPELTDDYDTRLKKLGKFQYNAMNDPRWSQSGHPGLQLIDWQREFFRIAPIQNYNFSISNSGDKTRYRISLGFIDQQGIAVNTRFVKANARASMETVFNNHFSFNFTISPSYQKTYGGTNLNGKNKQGAMTLAMVPVTEEEAGVKSGTEPYEGYAWGSTRVSPIEYMRQSTYEQESTGAKTQATVIYKINNGLSFEATTSFDFNTRMTNQFTPSYVTSKWDAGEGVNTTASERVIRGLGYMVQTLGKYNRSWNEIHNLDAMVGYSFEHRQNKELSASASNFPDNSLPIFNINDETITAATYSPGTPIRLVSMFARVQYDWNGILSVMGSIRRDGSSRLGKNNRWGWFPAVSGAFNVTRMNIWPEDFPMNQFKIRASWGNNGNNRITQNAALGILESANYSTNNSSIINGFAQGQLNNLNLGWEKTSSFDLGLDLGFFNNRVQLTVDYYDKITQSLLYKVKTPAVLGFEAVWSNVGHILNRGFEIELRTMNNWGNFHWNLSANVGYNYNEVTSLGNANETIYGGQSNTQVLQVGQPLNSYYMYDAVGVYQTRDDLLKYPRMSNTVVGDVRYRDVNDDGKIDDRDRTIVGKPRPDFTYGLRNTFKYKKWDFSFLFTAQTGGKILSLLGRTIDRPGMGSNLNVLSHWKNMWISEEMPGDGKTPGLFNSNTGQFYDTRWLYSTDFIKLKNVTIGYSLRFKKGHIKNLRLTLTGENLIMWDKYSGGFSPEANQGTTATAGNYDHGCYPQARTITIGAQATF